MPAGLSAYLGLNNVPTKEDAIANMQRASTTTTRKTNGVSTAAALMNQTGGSIMGFTYE